MYGAASRKPAVAFLVPVTLMMHALWRLDEPAAIHVQQAMFMKNVALLGAALLATQLGAGPLSLDARRAAAPASHQADPGL